TMNNRFVSPGGVVMTMGSVNVSVPKALVVTYPVTGGVGGRFSVGTLTRLLNPNGWAIAPATKRQKASPIACRADFMFAMIRQKSATVKAGTGAASCSNQGIGAPISDHAQTS